MGRHVAVRKAPPLLALAPLVAGAGAGTGAAATGAAATGAAGAGLGATAATTAGTGLGAKLAQGAKKVAVAAKDATQQRIGAVGVKDAAEVAQNQANAQAAQQQQTMQNNIQSAKDTAQQAKDQAGIAKAWQMLFKAGVEVHHDEPLPQEFTQDIATLDRNHQMMPTENGTMINNISPHMLRTIELMAQNHKDDETFTPKPFEMPTTFH